MKTRDLIMALLPEDLNKEVYVWVDGERYPISMIDNKVEGIIEINADTEAEAKDKAFWRDKFYMGYVIWVTSPAIQQEKTLWQFLTQLPYYREQRDEQKAMIYAWFIEWCDEDDDRVPVKNTVLSKKNADVPKEQLVLDEAWLKSVVEKTYRDPSLKGTAEEMQERIKSGDSYCNCTACEDEARKKFEYTQKNMCEVNKENYPYIWSMATKNDDYRKLNGRQKMNVKKWFYLWVAEREDATIVRNTAKIIHEMEISEVK